MGTPDFAVESLKALIDAGYEVVGVVTAPDKPAGRGQKLSESAVKEYALAHNLTLLQPTNLKDERFSNLKPWNVQWAVGGGPVLMTNGKINITNNQEHKFAGKAILDRHPRTAMGYTQDNKIIILAVQGRFPGIAEGATLTQEAHILKDLGCWEALNLDGGGSSCLLVNGKEDKQCRKGICQLTCNYFNIFSCSMVSRCNH